MTGTRGVICVVDDDDGVRRGLSQLLGHAGYTVAEFGSASAFLEAGLTTPPACVVVDLRLPGDSGLDLLAAMRERGTRAPAIMLTGYGDVPTAVQAMKAGAYDFVEKPYVPENLLRTVEEAVRSGPGWRSGTAKLTQRQQEIYDQLHHGASPEDVAKSLNLSVKTVYAHRQAIMDKLGLASHEFARSSRTTA